jgi:hypothetical protein
MIGFIMDWQQLTRKICEEFQLQGCFLFHRETRQWEGDKPPATFRAYLNQLFDTKESSYFEEIRFFRLAESKTKTNSRFLALMPASLEHAHFNFIGLIYQSPEQLQELLKFRILPMYLIFYLDQITVETEAAARLPKEQQVLMQALEEKRSYARQLESRVKNLSSDIDKIKRSEMGLDQKVRELTKMLEMQNREYTVLVHAYQELFQDFQNSQTEFLQTFVAFEEQVNNLESENHAMKQKLAKGPDLNAVPEYHKMALDLAETKKREQKAAEAYTELKKKARKMQNRLTAYQEASGGVTPLQVQQLAETLQVEREKAESYRKRCIQLELVLRGGGATGG